MSNKTAAPVMAFILVLVLIDIMGIGLVIPVLPGLVKELAGSDAAGARTIGILSAAYAIMQFLMAPILGRLSDRFGRRPVLLISIAGMALDYILLYFAPNLAWLFLGRLLAGATAGSLAVINAYVADVSPPEKRAANFGLIGATVGVGFVVGPMLGGLLGEYGLRTPFLFAAGLAGLSFLYGLFVLPESLLPEKRLKAWRGADLNPIKPLGALGKYPTIRNLVLGFIFFGLAGQVLYNVWVLFTELMLSWTPKQNGLALGVFGVLSALVQGGLIGYVVSRWGERKTIYAGLIFATIEMLLMALTHSVPMLMLALVVGSLGGLAGPAIQGYVSKQVSEHEQGSVQGAISSLNSLVAVVGALLSTFVFAAFTAENAPVYYPNAPFLMGVFLSLIGLFFIRQAFMKNDALAEAAQKGIE